MCPRLYEFRCRNKAAWPDWHNAPVPSFGADDAWLLVVGLAPGLKGANQTGRPFTGDHAGHLLFATLITCGLANGEYGMSAGDGLRLLGCRITNAVRCVPPENRPTPAEIAQCGSFLTAEMADLRALRAVVALGTIAHASVLASRGLKKSQYPFRHGSLHVLPDDLLLADSYHCSRQNTNTGRLTPEMFETVFHNVLRATGRGAQRSALRSSSGGRVRS